MIQLKSLVLLFLLSVSVYSVTSAVAQTGTNKDKCSVLVFTCTDSTDTTSNATDATFEFKYKIGTGSYQAFTAGETFQKDTFSAGTSDKTSILYIKEGKFAKDNSILIQCNVTYTGTVAQPTPGETASAVVITETSTSACTKYGVTIEHNAGIKFVADNPNQTDTWIVTGSAIAKQDNNDVIVSPTANDNFAAVYSYQGAATTQNLVLYTYKALTNAQSAKTKCDVNTYTVSYTKVDTNNSLVVKSIYIKDGATTINEAKYASLVVGSDVKIVVGYAVLDFGKTITFEVTLDEQKTGAISVLKSKYIYTVAIDAAVNNQTCVEADKLTLTDKGFNADCTKALVESSGTTASVFSAVGATLTSTSASNKLEDAALLSKKVIIISKESPKAGFLVVDNSTKVCSQIKLASGAKACEDAKVECIRQAGGSSITFNWVLTPAISGFNPNTKALPDSTNANKSILTIPKDTLAGATAYTLSCNTLSNSVSENNAVTNSYTPTKCDSGTNDDDDDDDNSQILSILALILLALLL